MLCIYILQNTCINTYSLYRYRNICLFIHIFIYEKTFTISMQAAPLCFQVVYFKARRIVGSSSNCSDKIKQINSICLPAFCVRHNICFEHTFRILLIHLINIFFTFFQVNHLNWLSSFHHKGFSLSSIAFLILYHA